MSEVTDGLSHDLSAENGQGTLTGGLKFKTMAATSGDSDSDDYPNRGKGFVRNVRWKTIASKRSG